MSEPLVVATQILRKSKKNRKPVGAMVAVKAVDKEGLRFGMARYHPSKEDLPFTKTRAKNIAMDRAVLCDFYIYSDGTTPKEAPDVHRAHTVHPAYHKIVKRFIKKHSEKENLQFLNVHIVLDITHFLQNLNTETVKG